VTDGNDRAETWKPVPNASRYEVSDKGRVRRDGHVLAQSVKNGYLQVKYTDDTGKRRDALVHRLVLLAHAGPPGKGQESCHSKAGPLFNWWPEGVRWDTKKANEAEKGPSQVMIFDCLDGCGTKVRKESRRCPDCVAAAGRKLTRMLEAGMNLEVAAVRMDYSSDWAYRIAVEHGGYSRTKREARLQQPSVTQRLRITLRDRREDGWGDAA
jgi:hypothetical protein